MTKLCIKNVEIRLEYKKISGVSTTPYGHHKGTYPHKFYTSLFYSDFTDNFLKSPEFFVKYV